MHKLSILVVDDNEDMRELLTRKLSHIGLSVCSTGDGLSAIELWTHYARKGKPFNGVLLDICLPTINGIAVARAIRCIEQGQNVSTHRTRVGFLSAVTEQFEETNAFDEVQATLHLQKPTDLSDLDNKISKWLGLTPCEDSSLLLSSS